MLNLRPFLFNTARTILLIGLAISVAAVSGIAQSGNAPAANGDAAVRADLAFDVVSIRPSSARPNQVHLQVMPGGDRYEAIGMPLGWTILMAYFPIRMGSTDRIVGAPGWVWNDMYDVVGKVREADLPAWQKLSERLLTPKNPMLEAMLQRALVDRCKMVVHRVPTPVDGYALVVAKHGPNRKNLAESKPGESIPKEAMRIGLDGRMVPIYPGREPVIHFYETSIAALILEISGSTVIEDRTGLSGKYRFDLTSLGTEGVPSSDWDLAPLGLKLVPIKVLSEKIVIDHIERPSPN